MKKPTIIIIRGAKPLKSKSGLLQKIILFIYKNFFNFIPQYREENLWTKVFEKDGFNVTEIKWDGRIMSFFKSKLKNKIKQIIENNHETDYVFVAESLGTEIALVSIDENRFKNVKGVIAICPVNKPRIIKNFKLIIINSESDKFEKFSNKILWPLHLLKHSKGNVKTIKIPNLRHDQFTPEQKIGEKYLKNLIYSEIKGI